MVLFSKLVAPLSRAVNYPSRKNNGPLLLKGVSWVKLSSNELSSGPNSHAACQGFVLHRPFHYSSTLLDENNVKFKLADIGEGIHEVELMQWFVKEGDMVRQFDRICEVQSDKATVEITSRYDGKVKTVHHEQGTNVQVGATLVTIELDEASHAGSRLANEPEKPSLPASKEFKKQSSPHQSPPVSPPPLGLNGSGGAALPAAPPPPAAGAPTAAAGVGPAARARALLLEKQQQRRQPLFRGGHSSAAAAAAAWAPCDVERRAAGGTPARGGGSGPPPPPPPPPPTGARRALAAPAVRRRAKEAGVVSLSEVPATGPGGVVTRADLERYLATAAAAADEEGNEAAAAAPPPLGPGPFAEVVPGTVVPFTPVMRAMSKAMERSLAVPHMLLSEEVEMDRLMALRAQLRGEVEGSLAAAAAAAGGNGGGGKLTFMPFILKTTSIALAQYPILNSSIHESGDQVVYHENHNIGVAMDTPQGLIVPVINEVQNKSILDIAAELNELQYLGKEGKISPERMRGATFGISNIGIIGGTYTAPVVIPPQVGIGALGKIKKVPKFDESDKVVPAHIANISWSADHRVVDGAALARFSSLWKRSIENPATMLAFLK